MMIDDGRARPYKEDDAENSVDHANLFIPGTFWDAQQKKQCGSVDVRSWLDPCKSYQTRLGDDSESEGRPALVRAAQLSSPLLYREDTAVQLCATLV